jgi:hypothetical protein
MLDDKRRLWRLQRKVYKARDDLVNTQLRYKRGEVDKEFLWATQKQLRSLEAAFQRSESNFLIKEAQRKGIEIPRKPEWWDDDREEYARDGMPQREIDLIMSEWLTETGIFGVRKIFKEERRRAFEWWYTKVVIPTLQASVPIIALFLVYFSKK